MYPGKNRSGRKESRACFAQRAGTWLPIADAMVENGEVQRVQGDKIIEIARQRGFMPDLQQIEREAWQMCREWLHRKAYAAMMGVCFSEMEGIEETPENLFAHFRQEALQEAGFRWIVQDLTAKKLLSISPEELEQEAKKVAQRQHVTTDAVKELLGEDLNALRRDLMERKTLAWIGEEKMQPSAE